MARAGEEGHEDKYYAPRRLKPPPPPPTVWSTRPASLAEPRGDVVQVTRHAAGSMDLVPLVQILDAPVPPMVDQMVGVLKILLFSLSRST